KRRALARPFLEGGVKSGHRLLQPRRAALSLPERGKRDAEIGLSSRPIQRHALARPFLERGAISGDRLLQPRCAALPLPERFQRGAQIGLRRRPLKGYILARGLTEQCSVKRDSGARRIVVAFLRALTVIGVSLSPAIVAPPPGFRVWQKIGRGMK